ncbi:MAG: magnesium transporter [Bacteroidota bacterium]|nr:magnesium transporter [Bacteroidota bacterium]
MAAVSTFYFSRIIGYKVYSENQNISGKLHDLIVDQNFIRPKVIAAQVKFGNQTFIIDFNFLEVHKEKGQYHLKCKHIEEFNFPHDNILFIRKHILDKQIVDIEGKKLVRVNDIRLALLSNGTYLVAVDVGIEGLMRRLSVAKPIKKLLSPFGISLPSNLILWDDVSTIGYDYQGLKLSMTQSKLSTLHPSDLADIIEDLDQKTQVALFSSFDDERAADVLEELELDAQKRLIESLSVERAADVLERMPADEAADILDELEDEKVEELLEEMEDEASDEVRELMEYPDNTVGSLMNTDHISFLEDMTADEAIKELRRLKPEADTIYYLYVLDKYERLAGTVSLRDIIVSEPETELKDIMNQNVIKVYDLDKIDSLAEIISKYNLLALPVVDEEEKLVGMVIIDDVVFTLLKQRRRRA